MQFTLNGGTAFGAGYGYGGSFEFDETSVEAAAYINPANIAISVDSVKVYSSIYIGCNITFRGIECGPEIHLILDWSTLSFENVSEDIQRFSDIEFGVSLYKHKGVRAKLIFK